MPPRLHVLGSADLLNGPLFALFCSKQCPASIIVKAQDWARVSRNNDLAFLGGFHTSVEQECLRVFLKGSCPIVLCPARGLPKRIPREWEKPLEDRRLLVLSCFEDDVKRPTAETASRRNDLILVMAQEILVLHAPPSSRTFALAEKALSLKKAVWTLAAPANDSLVAMGARKIGA